MNGYNCGTYRDQDPHHGRYVRDTRAVPKQPEKSIGYRAAMKNDFAPIVMLIHENNQRIDIRVGKSGEVTLVTQHTFPMNSLDILKNPNIFIGDTGATADVTNDKTGCVNKQENSTLSVGIDGEASKCASQVDLPGILRDKKGNEKDPVTFTSMWYNSKANFNLNSLTKLIMDGWIMTGDKNGIVM